MKPDTVVYEGRWEVETGGSQEAHELTSPEVLFLSRQRQTLMQTWWKARTNTKWCLLCHSTWAPHTHGNMQRYMAVCITKLRNPDIQCYFLTLEHMEHLTFSWWSVPSEQHRTVQSFCDLPLARKGWLVYHVYAETSHRVHFCSWAIDFYSLSGSKFMGK